MTTKALWEPSPRKASTWGTQIEWDKLVKALDLGGGPKRYTLGPEHVDRLKAMGVVLGNPADTPYKALVAAIEKHGAISVFLRS